MSPRLDERVRLFQRRALVRSWEYRQRRHAHGVWFRLRRVLADAEAAYVVSTDDASAWAAEGFTPDPVGMELHPAKTIVFVPATRAASLPSAKPIPVGLGVEWLAAESIVLIPFAAAALHPGARHAVCR